MDSIAAGLTGSALFGLGAALFLQGLVTDGGRDAIGVIFYDGLQKQASGDRPLPVHQRNGHSLIQCRPVGARGKAVRHLALPGGEEPLPVPLL